MNKCWRKAWEITDVSGAFEPSVLTRTLAIQVEKSYPTVRAHHSSKTHGETSSTSSVTVATMCVHRGFCLPLRTFQSSLLGVLGQLVSGLQVTMWLRQGSLCLGGQRDTASELCQPEKLCVLFARLFWGEGRIRSKVSTQCQKEWLLSTSSAR